MKSVRSFLAAVVVLASSSHVVNATVLATNTIIVEDPTSLGRIQITSRVHDNFMGDFSKYLFEYEVRNVSYEPTPGTSNGLSGFQVVFTEQIPTVADQFAPAGWFFNCCGETPPFGAEADIDNSSGFGIAVGETDFLGYSVQAGAGWTDTWTDELGGPSWGHTWEFDSQENVFDLLDVGDSALTILTPIPESAAPTPSTTALLSLGLLGAIFARIRRNH